MFTTLYLWFPTSRNVFFSFFSPLFQSTITINTLKRIILITPWIFNQLISQFLIWTYWPHFEGYGSLPVRKNVAWCPHQFFFFFLASRVLSLLIGFFCLDRGYKRQMEVTGATFLAFSKGRSTNHHQRSIPFWQKLLY